MSFISPSHYIEVIPALRRLVAVLVATLSLFVAGSLGAPDLASAQTRRSPGPGYHPMKKNVTGFMQLSPGINYAPPADLEGESHVNWADFTVSDLRSSGPGYGVSFYLIPTWGKNGMHFGASYDMSAIRFSHKTGEGDAAVEGNSSLGVTDMVARVGYVRYFGKYDWHPYILGDGGLSWQTARLSTDYATQDDKVEDSKINTPLIGLGVGIGKKTTNGMFGGELRADFYPMTFEHDFPGPHDRFDLNLDRPVIFKLMAIFSIGHL
jgi:hypothetical protein